MLELPDDPTNPLKLADWLELTAMLSGDGNASRGDLERVLRRASLYETSDDYLIERKALEVFYELEQRGRAAYTAYPFDIDYGTLQIKSAWSNYPAYTFCLCLSYFGSKSSKPRKLFEQVSTSAAKGYLHGDALNFGFPRVNLPASFSEAVTTLCVTIGEGGGYNSLPSLEHKDDKLDVVAWKDFPDISSSKLLMFGQCASGWDWEGKLRELGPEAFCGNWMRESPVSPLISSIFIPHRIERQKWNSVARNAGIIFDRCRIAYWAHGAEMDYSPCIAWVNNLLMGTKGSAA